MENIMNKKVGEIVASDYRTAKVFKDHNIDFCCKGNRSVSEVCESNALDPETIIEELEASIANTDNSTNDFQSWPMDFLADYIVNKHHRYVEEKIPEIREYLDRISQVHGDRHPELHEITQLFNLSAGALAAHMKKEELVLFPFVKKMVQVKKEGGDLGNPYFGSVENPVEMMEHEHDTEGERFRKIAELSNNYTIPDDGCNTYHVAFSMLKAFEADLHEHIHLENNILFPKAIAMEKELNH